MSDITVPLTDTQKCAIGPSSFKDAHGNAIALPLPTGFSVGYASSDASIVTVDTPDADWNTFVRAVGPTGSAVVTGELLDGTTVVASHTWEVTVGVSSPSDFTPVAGTPAAE